MLHGQSLAENGITVDSKCAINLVLACTIIQNLLLGEGGGGVLQQAAGFTVKPSVPFARQIKSAVICAFLALMPWPVGKSCLLGSHGSEGCWTFGTNWQPAAITDFPHIIFKSIALVLRTCQDGGHSLLCRGHTCILLWLHCQIVLPLLLKMLSDCWLERVIPCADAHTAVKTQRRVNIGKDLQGNRNSLCCDADTDDLLTLLLSRSARAQGAQRFV